MPFRIESIPTSPSSKHSAGQPNQHSPRRTKATERRSLVVVSPHEEEEEGFKRPSFVIQTYANPVITPQAVSLDRKAHRSHNSRPAFSVNQPQQQQQQPTTYRNFPLVPIMPGKTPIIPRPFGGSKSSPRSLKKQSKELDTSKFTSNKTPSLYIASSQGTARKALYPRLCRTRDVAKTSVDKRKGSVKRKRLASPSSSWSSSSSNNSNLIVAESFQIVQELTRNILQGTDGGAVNQQPFKRRKVSEPHRVECASDENRSDTNVVDNKRRRRERESKASTPTDDQSDSSSSSCESRSTSSVASEVQSLALIKAKKQRLGNIKSRFEVMKSKIRRGASYSFEDFKKELLEYVEGDYTSIMNVPTQSGSVQCNVAIKGFSSMVMDAVESKPTVIPEWQQALMAPVHQRSATLA